MLWCFFNFLLWSASPKQLGGCVSFFFFFFFSLCLSLSFANHQLIGTKPGFFIGGPEHEWGAKHNFNRGQAFIYRYFKDKFQNWARPWPPPPGPVPDSFIVCNDFVIENASSLTIRVGGGWGSDDCVLLSLAVLPFPEPCITCKNCLHRLSFFFVRLLLVVVIEHVYNHKVRWLFVISFRDCHKT